MSVVSSRKRCTQTCLAKISKVKKLLHYLSFTWDNPFIWHKYAMCKSCGLTTNETIMMELKRTFVMPKKIGEGTEEGCKDRHAKKRVTHKMFL